MSEKFSSGMKNPKQTGLKSVDWGPYSPSFLFIQDRRATDLQQI